MGNPLSTIVFLTITQNSVGITEAGFGTMLILSANASFPDRVNYYSDPSDAVTDGFPIDSPEVLSLEAAFAQQPRPPLAAIGRANGAKTTIQYTLGMGNVRASHAYRINVKGQGVTPTPISQMSDSTATAPKIFTALNTALNAVVGKNFASVFAPVAFGNFTFTASDVGSTFTAAAHPLNTGDGPIEVSNSGGALPVGLAAATPYYAIVIDANTFQLADSLAHALAGTFLVITSNGTGTQTLDHQTGTLSPNAGLLVTASAAGDWFSLEMADGPLDLVSAQTHSDPGIAAELDLILDEGDDWYAIHSAALGNSLAIVQSIATWTQDEKRIYIADVAETNALVNNVTDDGSSDTLDKLHNLAFSRTAGGYHQDPSAMFSAAWMGRCLPTQPGSETWFGKRLLDLAPVNLTTTYQLHLTNKNANSFWTVAGVNITFNGQTSDGDFIDIQRGIDWLDQDMSIGIFTALITNDKVPYTDDGVQIIVAEIIASMKRAATNGILVPLSANPATYLTIPKVADADPANKAKRILAGLAFDGTFQGAIHKVLLNGNLST